MGQGVSRREQWEELYRRLDGYEAYCPRDVKAWAMALTVLGYSSRQTQCELRGLFPGEKIPNYATIARWQRSRPANTLAFLGWMLVSLRALDIIDSRLDEVQRMPFDKAYNAAAQATEIALLSDEGYRRRLPRYRA